MGSALIKSKKVVCIIPGHTTIEACRQTSTEMTHSDSKFQMIIISNLFISDMFFFCVCNLESGVCDSLRVAYDFNFAVHRFRRTAPNHSTYNITLNKAEMIVRRGDGTVESMPLSAGDRRT